MKQTIQRITIGAIMLMCLTAHAADQNVEVAKSEVVKQRLRVGKNAEKWKTTDSEFLVHLRCKVTTRQHRITMGAAKGKLKDSDLAAFDDFKLILSDKNTVTAIGLGHTMTGQVTLYRAPKEYGNLVDFNILKKYVWDVDVVFVLPKGTRSANFQFGDGKPVAIAIPAELE